MKPTITNIYWWPWSWKTIIADWLKKKLLLEWRTVYLYDEVDEETDHETIDDILNTFASKSSMPHQIVVVSAEKIEDKKIDYWVNTFKL